MHLLPSALFLCLLGVATDRPVAAVSQALRLWEQGQQARLEGQVDVAIECYEKSLQRDEKLARNYLSLAAAFLEKGQDQAAATWMARYLEHQPDHHVIRSHFAELLIRLNQPSQA